MSDAAFAEDTLAFDCAGDRLLGIVSRPAPGANAQAAGSAAQDLGVVVVVGGPQYRAGSHRGFVLLARHLASLGLTVLRFDVRGMGDSEGALHDFQAVDADVDAAIAALLRHSPQLRRVALWGLCDGASAALLYLQRQPDPRVAALCLLNPWVRSAETLAKTHVKHYYRQRLQQPEFWRKLFSGQVAGKALAGLMSNLRLAFSRPTGHAEAASTGIEPQAPFPRRMAEAYAAFGGPSLLMLSERDHTAQEFTEHSRTDATWQQALARRPPQRVLLAGADHTCSQPTTQQAMEVATGQFLAALAGAPPITLAR